MDFQPESHPDHSAWAEMLARIAEKNGRLGDLVTKRWPPRSGLAILAELERERGRIARELHAGAGQPLAGIKLHLEILDGFSGGMPASARNAIGRLQTLADQALGQVRAVSHRLHPPDWQELTMEQAMAALIESSGLRGSLQLAEDIRPLPVEPAHGIKIQMYRCAQECISNIIRHSRATEAGISLISEGDRMVLTVTDNGRGFEPGAGKAGIGLRALSASAASMGGSSRIDSSHAGTRIVVSLPFDED